MINIEKNKEEYLARFDQYIGQRPGAEGLRKFLVKSDFFTAPASTKYHLAEAGGLCQHSLNVDDVLTEMMFTEGTFWNRYAVSRGLTRENIACVALLHDLCKVYNYSTESRNKKSYDPADIAEAKAAGEYVKKDSKGEFVWKTVESYIYEDKMPLGHGEKSVMLAMNYIKLTSEEMYAIRWHMGLANPKELWRVMNDAFDKFALAVAAHEADMTATHLLECENFTEAFANAGQEPVDKEVKDEAEKQDADGIPADGLPDLPPMEEELTLDDIQSP